MELAQALYEGVDLDGERVGLITYMRTDGVAVSATALAAARRVVRRDHGAAYLARRARVFRSRAGNGREAHEAIRPTEFERTPGSLAGRLEPDARRLYGLIRDRALASQMRAARFERIELDLATPGGEVALEARGMRLVFDGFLRVYGEAEEAANGAARALPEPSPGARVAIGAVRTVRRATCAPARYTEAGLVRRLDELGIGRPSTWAAIVTVLEERRYVARHGGGFVALERGRVVTAFLESFFARWVAYGFTAQMERELDRVAGGAAAWRGVLERFWSGFAPALEETGALERAEVVAAIEARLAVYIHGAGAGRRSCPLCGEGALVVKASRPGLFVGCARWPDCEYRRALARPGDGAAGDAAPKRLGTDPGSGLAVTLRRGPHGHYVERRPAHGAPRRMSVPGGMDPETVDLDTALGLLALPREVGAHPASGEPVLAGIGRYGPWVRHRATYAAIGDDDDVLTVGLNRAVHLIAEKEIRLSRARGPKRVLRELGAHPGDGAPVWLKTGHYGPFVAHRRSYASVPEDLAPEDLTLERALALLAPGPGAGRRGRS